MLKSLLTLVRGTANDRLEATLDRNALTMLDQQIRDCGTAIDTARKALAVAIAQNKQEQARITRLAEQIADLEARASEALRSGHQYLALEAAEAIAALEIEHEATTEAQQRFQGECERLRSIVSKAQARLRDLERGRRSAKAHDAVLRLRDKGLIASEDHRNTLSDAEATLSRLQARQSELDHASAALEDLEAEHSPKTIKEKLTDAGFGPSTKKRAEDVLERLKAKAEAQPPNTDETSDPQSNN